MHGRDIKILMVLATVLYPIPKQLCCKKGEDKKVQVTE